MDTLIALGATVAFGFSLVVVISQQFGAALDQPLYFAESAGLLALISIGHWLEVRSSAAAGTALRDLLALQPEIVTVLESADDPTGTQLRTTKVQQGMLLLVKPGDRVAVDGIIERGDSSLDQSAITGEPIPVDLRAGDAVIAGSVNLSSAITVRTTTTGGSTTLTRIAELVAKAQSTKTNIQKLADIVSGIFVPAVLSIAVLTVLGWLFFGGDSRWSQAIISATSVLIISCPCALGLATPTAVMVASGAASKRGIIVRSAMTLERAAHVRTVLLDKTGTLTIGKPQVHSADDDTLALAAALSQSSNHPLSKAIVEAATARSLRIPTATNVSESPGIGLTGSIDGRSIELISLAQALSRGTLTDDNAEQAGTASVVLESGSPLGTITFEDQPREDANALISALHNRNMRAVLLTGDRRAAALALALPLGFREDEIHAELSPQQKVEQINEYAHKGVVAMVGDGINDAAALAQAGASGGIGIAMASGTNIAMESADAIIPGEHLGAIVELLQIGRSALRTIKQNLTFSFFYNSMAIPAAAFGLLGSHGPLFAAGAMALSDLCVIGNSVRLRTLLSRLFTRMERDL